MARKRLNKKVALIGSAVFVLLVLLVIGVILYLSRDPEKFIQDGNAALKAAREATDEQIKTEQYKKAEYNYHKARSLARDDSLKVKMLSKLVNLYLETDRWRNVLGCWNRIIQIDPKNIKARFGRLKYVYIVADSGGAGHWREVESQVSEFIEIADANLLAEDTSKWESFEIQKGMVAERVGAYLYLLRGRATFEIARLGAVTDPDKSLARAIDDLEKVVGELEPGNVDAYWYLAQAIITKGQILASRGNLEERDKAVDSAVLMLARDSGSIEQIQSLEPEFLSLVEKFDSSAEAHSALAEFYMGLGYENLDKAIEAAEKAIELDKENVAYAISAANLHYRNYSIYGQNPEISRAVEIAGNALTLPDVQDKQGPRQWANGMNRILLYDFLANCYIEQILQPQRAGITTELQKQELIAKAESVVHEIEQFFGSGEEPQVVKWQGMLELAKGNKDAAIKKLYAVYEQLKASGIEDAEPSHLQRSYAQLSYTLAKLFENTSEVGAVTEFLASALRAGISWTKPEALLDYVEVMLRLEMWPTALSHINAFEENFGPNKRNQMLRIRAYIGARQFDKAEEELAKAELDDPNAVKLNLALAQARIRRIRGAIAQKQMKESLSVIFQQSEAEKEGVEMESSVQSMADEVKGNTKLAAGLMEKLLEIEPNSVEKASLTIIYNNYIAQGQIKQAKHLVNKFLEYFPDSTTGLYYKQALSEPELANISRQRRREIRWQVLSNIADPIRRAVELGVFYQGNNEPNKAAEEFKKVLAASERAGDEEITDSRRFAVGGLFEIALGMEDWELAAQMEETGRRENSDGCEGQFFAARLAMAKGQYKDALAKIEQCLKQRPVFSSGFVLRSNVNTALGNEHKSIEDARKALSLNPLDGGTAGVLASALVRRNQKLGDNVSSEQIMEARNALDMALARNPGNLRLSSFYAEYISSTEPERALAMRQALQKAAPSLENALLLGRMAMKMAVKETNTDKKEALFAIAASSFEEAQAFDPQNKAVLQARAVYYRATDQREKAEELLAQSQDKKLLWVHYFRAGRFEDARNVLEQLYQTDSNDISVVKGLLFIAEKTTDTEAVKKYSEEFLSLSSDEDRIVNHLIQIQTFLSVGLLKEAEYKLQSFKEKYSDQPGALLLEAWLAMKQGQMKKALELG